MIPRSHVAHRRNACIDRRLRVFGRFQQRIGRLLRFERADDVRFSAQAKMDMTVDESWDHRETAAVDTDSPFWDSDLIAWADRHDLCAAHEERRIIVKVTRPIDEPYVINGNCHS